MEPNQPRLDARGGTINVTPLGMLGYAECFLQAARAIPVQDGYSPVRYYLLCHSIELGLKAFLLTKGKTLKYLKNDLKHDLTRVAKEAEGLGLAAVTPDEDRELQAANEYYLKKGFEYFLIEHHPYLGGRSGLPELSVLESLASRLVTTLRPVCISCT